MAYNPKCWMRCVECGHRQMERRTAVGRRTIPHCVSCGGMLEISKDAGADLASGVGRLREVQEQHKQHGLGT